MNFDITNYPEFRTEAMTLKSNIGIMLNKMDGVMNSENFSIAAKSSRVEQLMNEYLPT